MIDVLAGFILGVFFGYLIFYVIIARYFRYKLEEAEKSIDILESANQMRAFIIKQLEQDVEELSAEKRKWQ